jgi:hypothetical protein
VRRLAGRLDEPLGAGTPRNRLMIPLTVIVLLVGLFFLPSGPGDLSDAFAQTPSPSGFTIELINPGESVEADPVSGPDDGPGNEVSDKPESLPAGQTGDSVYHLVAWVNQVPPGASVEFKVQSTADGSTEQNLGTGTQVGGSTGDTFEKFWNPPDTDDEFDVRAVLFSSGVEVARDEETADVNTSGSATPPSQNEPLGETVEINYPINGGPIGFFTPTGTDVPVTVLDVKFSDGATTIDVFYTVSAPGTEAEWKNCGDSEDVDDAADGVRCTLQDGDQPAAVRAVAARVSDGVDLLTTPQVDESPDSGDVHRAFPYVQTPGSVTLAPTSQGKVAGNCSDVITATVLDTQNRKIPGVNVDVHAKGPTDQLQFDDGEGDSHPNQPPDKGHTAPDEPARNCEDGGNANEQGEHEVALPDIDTKHIESVDGTNDAGAFLFQLFSPDAGTAQATAFADTDDDDLFCSEEKSGNASVDWSAASPPPGGTSPTGLPADTTSCPSPSPTASPTTTPSPTQTTTASPTSSPTGGGTPRTVTLISDDDKVNAGATVNLSGQIVSSDQSCEDDEFIRIRRRVHGTTTFKELTTAQTAADGTFEADVKVNANADFVAFAAGHDQCADDTSDPVQVLAKVKVTAKSNFSGVPKGEKVKITGSVNPDHDGTKVILQRKKSGVFEKVESDKLNKQSKFEFVLTVNWNGKRIFRVKWKSQDENHEAGKSDNVPVRAT